MENIKPSKKQLVTNLAQLINSAILSIGQPSGLVSTTALELATKRAAKNAAKKLVKKLLKLESKAEKKKSTKGAKKTSTKKQLAPNLSVIEAQPIAKKVEKPANNKATDKK